MKFIFTLAAVLCANECFYKESLMILLLVLKVDYEDIEKVGMANRSLSMWARIVYLIALLIHHKISNS